MTDHPKKPAWIIYREGEAFQPRLESRSPECLPCHDTLIEVLYSSLNYKDALSWTGHPGITRAYPHQPGIDAAGIVLESADASLVGREVIVTGFDLGMNTAGGHGGWIRVPAEWVIPKPDALELIDCMTIGTAGFTAAQSLYRMQQNRLATDAGEIVVTGATGGVGSVAVNLLSAAGYQVVAATRQSDQEDWLHALGASAVVKPDEVLDDSGKPMISGRWAGAVDTVGGALLESILKSTRQRAVVTCCGMIGGIAVSSSMFPFILRGVALIGIDSAECPLAEKKKIWAKLASEWRSEKLELLRSECPLKELPDAVAKMKEGATTGRVVVIHG